MGRGFYIRRTYVPNAKPLASYHFMLRCFMIVCLSVEGRRGSGGSGFEGSLLFGPVVVELRRVLREFFDGGTQDRIFE